MVNKSSCLKLALLAVAVFVSTAHAQVSTIAMGTATTLLLLSSGQNSSEVESCEAQYAKCIRAQDDNVDPDEAVRRLQEVFAKEQRDKKAREEYLRLKEAEEAEKALKEREALAAKKQEQDRHLQAIKERWKDLKFSRPN